MMRAVHPWSKKGQGFDKLSPNDICGGAIAHPVRAELVEGLSFFVQRAAPSAARPNPKTFPEGQGLKLFVSQGVSRV
ncbi:hypothetical protein [Sphingomonas lycopersici]|uniref:Uncharacterized protein n=1 Tax=Sphingomonas lycopersici TaxID=2951807 RepID=A0AA41ZGX6_9SPHN|nr:hypothetical protein [Sphingomonas lycopersici]MCW6535483.1 hypothetical protein [Sphingomonas lycopersici]